jgi:hypothetical protein
MLLIVYQTLDAPSIPVASRSSPYQLTLTVYYLLMWCTSVAAHICRIGSYSLASRGILSICSELS